MLVSWADNERRHLGRAALVKTLRWRLRLTQEEFSERYRIPLGTLRDWEQHRCEPDQTAQAYIAALGVEPERIAHALRPRRRA